LDDGSKTRETGEKENARMVKTVMSRVVSVFALALAWTAVAQGEVAFSTGADLVSDYVWRGQVLNDDGALQPWVELAYAGFTLNVWGSIDLDDTPNDAQWKFTEVDVTASYAVPIGAYALDVGVISYSFPNTGVASTWELFGTLTLSDVVLSPFVSLYYDVAEVDGFYLQVGGAYGQEMATWSWELAASLAVGSEDYNEGYFGVADFALNDLTVTFTVEFPLSASFSVTGFVSGSWLLDDAIGDAVADDSSFVVGAGASYTF
jgi:hypothetical protein